MLCLAFDLEQDLSTEELRKVILNRFRGLDRFTIDKEGTLGFIMRLTKTMGNNDNWLETILMFLGNKPTGKWLDSDQDKAESQLTKFSQRVVELEKINFAQQKGQEEISGDFDVHFLRSFKQDGLSFEKVLLIDGATSTKVADVVAAIGKNLKRLDSHHLAFAALAQVLDAHFNVPEVPTEKKNTLDNSELSEDTP